MAILAVALAVACAAPAAGAAAPAGLKANAAASSQRAACSVSVTIAGKRTCLATGKSCRLKYESRYKTKGFSCKRTSKGTYRLKKTKLVF